MTCELLGVRPTKPADGRIERIVGSGGEKKKNEILRYGGWVGMSRMWGGGEYEWNMKMRR